eukprot:516033-Amphidinium_carterae.1
MHARNQTTWQVIVYKITKNTRLQGRFSNQLSRVVFTLTQLPQAQVQGRESQPWATVQDEHVRTHKEPKSANRLTNNAPVLHSSEGSRATALRLPCTSSRATPPSSASLSD